MNPAGRRYCGLKNKGLKKILNPQFEIGRPMLFTQKLLAPRATTEAPRNCQTLLVTPEEPKVYLRAFNKDDLVKRPKKRHPGESRGPQNFLK
jgi:hypothetical protein